MLGLALLLSTLLLNSCDNLPWFHDSDKCDCMDSTYVAQEIEKFVNPQFNSVDEIIVYKMQNQDGITIDSIFWALPDNVLSNVASVLFNKGKTVTKKSIVEEYRAGINIYSNLPANTKDIANTTTDQNTSQSVDLGSTDLGNRHADPIISTTYKYRNDTINGKPVKIQIKQEESVYDGK